jgi:hypothetical protein
MEAKVHGQVKSEGLSELSKSGFCPTLEHGIPTERGNLAVLML